MLKAFTLGQIIFPPALVPQCPSSHPPTQDWDFVAAWLQECAVEKKGWNRRGNFFKAFFKQRLGGGGDVGWVSGWIHKRQSVILSVKLGWIAVNQSDHHRHNHHRHRDPAFIPRWVSFKFKLPSPSSVRLRVPPSRTYYAPDPREKDPFFLWAAVDGRWNQSFPGNAALTPSPGCFNIPVICHLHSWHHHHRHLMNVQSQSRNSRNFKLRDCGHIQKTMIFRRLR